MGRFLKRCFWAVGGLFFCAMPVLAQHEHHHHHEAVQQVSVVNAEYAVPDLKLTRADGTQRDFAKELDAGGGAVVLNFIYTSCTAICPMSSQIFSALQNKLSSEATKVKFISISIDPEYDTPARLAAYAKKYGAGPNWQFYTGTVKNSVAIQKAFEAYRGDKMNHVAVTFMRKAPGQPWTRVEGMVGSDELLEIYRGLGKGAVAAK